MRLKDLPLKFVSKYKHKTEWTYRYNADLPKEKTIDNHRFFYDVILGGFAFSVDRTKRKDPVYKRDLDYCCFYLSSPVFLPDGTRIFSNTGRNFRFIDTENLPKRTPMEIAEYCADSILWDYNYKNKTNITEYTILKMPQTP